MAESELPPSTPTAAVPRRLQEIAQLLRTTHHLGPEAQQALARLAEDLAAAPPEESAHLIESTSHVIEALHHEHGHGLLGAARGRLEQSIVGLEARAPHAADFARRLLDALANLGI